MPRGGPHVVWPGRERESPSISALRGGVGAQQVNLTVRALALPWAQGRGGFSDVIHQKPEGPCSVSTVSSSRPESLLSSHTDLLLGWLWMGRNLSSCFFSFLL